MKVLALPLVREYYIHMSPEMEDAVRRALEAAPSSDRALAREAGISPALLSMIRSGERAATPDVVAALADGLDRLSARHVDAARVLWDALQDQEEQ